MTKKFEQAKYYFLEGIKHLENGDLDLSENALLKSLEILPNRDSTLHNLSVVYTQKADSFANLSKFEEAIRLYNLAISHDNKNFIAWSNLGITYGENLNNYGQAINCYEKAISLCDSYFDAYYNLANTLSKVGRLDESIINYDRSLLLSPENVDAMLNKGISLSQLQRHGAAIGEYNKILKIEPSHSHALLNKGISLYQLQQFEEAIAEYDKILKIEPGHPDALLNKGISLYQLQKFEESITYYDSTLKLKPDHILALLNKGILLNQLQRHQDAIAQYDKALKIKPDYQDALLNKGVTLYNIKKFAEAITHYNLVLELNPKSSKAWSNRGVALNELKSYDQALHSYDKALETDADFIKAWCNKGATLFNLKRYEEAANHYSKALDLDQDADFIFGDYIHTKMKMCDWKSFDKNIEKLINLLNANKSVIQPFSLLSLIDDPNLHLKCSQIYSKYKFQNLSEELKLIQNSPSNKIRIGYYSADFHNHATSYLIAELLEEHNRDKFEIFGFSFGPNSNDEMRQRVSRTFNQFFVVNDLSDCEVAELSRSLKIDIAIDLKGYTQDARTGIFQNRCAPIQINYLGYPGTMGVDFIDYLISDSVISTKEAHINFSEKIIELPNSYQPNDSTKKMSLNESDKSSYGLPQDGFVFCCFNNNYKILPNIFNAWMNILKAVDNSVLWLMEDNHWVSNNLRNEASIRGVNSNRLIFAKRTSLDKHLARHHFADLFLDTTPYNAHTTASDALWSDLPVLTLAGNSFASRVASSLLNAAGTPELITTSIQEYQMKAIELATDRNTLMAIKAKIAGNKLSMQLFDIKSYTKNLELAYETVYGNYHLKKTPISFRVN